MVRGAAPVENAARRLESDESPGERARLAVAALADPAPAGIGARAWSKGPIGKLMIGSGILILAAVVIAGALLGSASPSRPAPRAIAHLTPPRVSRALAGASSARVSRSSSVTVDALTWHLMRSYTDRRIASQYLVATANGVYLIADVAVTNRSGRPVSLNTGQVALRAGHLEFAPDPSAMSVLELQGRRSLFSVGVSPAATATGWVVFNLSNDAAAKTSELCFAGTAAGRVGACLKTVR